MRAHLESVQKFLWKSLLVSDFKKCSKKKKRPTILFLHHLHPAFSISRAITTVGWSCYYSFRWCRFLSGPDQMPLWHLQWHPKLNWKKITHTNNIARTYKSTWSISIVNVAMQLSLKCASQRVRALDSPAVNDDSAFSSLQQAGQEQPAALSRYFHPLCFFCPLPLTQSATNPHIDPARYHRGFFVCSFILDVLSITSKQGIRMQILNISILFIYLFIFAKVKDSRYKMCIAFGVDH